MALFSASGAAITWIDGITMKEALFEDVYKRQFLNSTYTVTNESDRMGCKLSGDKIEYKNTVDIISDGIVFGSIQIPRTGNPIIMLADRQTTGGYACLQALLRCV